MNARDNERQDSIQDKKRFDTGWTLAAILTIYLVAMLPLQHLLWRSIAAYGPTGNAILLGLVSFAGIALALGIHLTAVTSRQLAISLSDWLLSHRRAVTRLLIAAAAIIPAVVAWSVLDGFANSGDENAYLFQATQFAGGHLWAAAPPLGDVFVPLRTWIIDDKWLSQYPPGWPAALTAGHFVGLPAWLVNAVLGAGGTACLLSPLWPFRDRALSLAVGALYLGSAFYIFNAASLFPHVLTALLILLVCLTCRWYQLSQRLVAVAACGVLLGLIGLTRYFSLVLLFPALAYWLFVENRVSRLRMIGVLVLAGLPFLACLMLYQYWITGSPLRDTYSLITTDDVYLSVKPADVIYGLQLVPARFAELIVWASPLLLPIYGLCLWVKAKARAIAFYDLIFPSFIVGYVFFADPGGNRYGPRYYFDAFPVMLVTILSARPQLALLVRRLNLHALSLNTLAICAVYFLTALPFAFKYYHTQVIMREQPYRLAAARQLANAIVVIETSSGHGMEPEDLARNRPDLLAPVLYARRGASLADLRNAFPDRSIWRYARVGNDAEDLKLVLPAASAAAPR